ncbi:MAG: helix-turn-helix transcriptional regulator, partial [Clostridia bacterium]|nr:helix-turn-helix transcriptional regulator [Clostridia bacterium]
MKLAENIRSFRKERSLTQEQLAEVLGVTPGAVYKWEAKLSMPELNLIMEMADFFDTSVDMLLGYEMKDNRLEATVKRLQECRRNK